MRQGGRYRRSGRPLGKSRKKTECNASRHQQSLTTAAEPNNRAQHIIIPRSWEQGRCPPLYGQHSSSKAIQPLRGLSPLHHLVHHAHNGVDCACYRLPHHSTSKAWSEFITITASPCSYDGQHTVNQARPWPGHSPPGALAALVEPACPPASPSSSCGSAAPHRLLSLGSCNVGTTGLQLYRPAWPALL